MGWVIGIGVAGLALIAWPLATAGDGLASVWQSVGVNVGTALLLAAPLVYIEPRFKTRIAKAAAEGADSKYETRVEELTGRVDDLQASTRELFERYGAVEDQKVAEMVSRPDFYTVSSALVEANKSHAIDRILGVTIPAVGGIPEILVRFRYMSPTSARPGYHAHDFLDVTPVVLTPAPNGHFWPVEERWRVEESADQVGARLMKTLQDAGLKSVTDRVDWKSTIDRLGTALDLAFESKRSDGMLVGHIIEMGPEGWFLTSAGIEHLEQGVVVDVKEFPPKWEGALGVAGALLSGRPPESIDEHLNRFDESPEWADSDEWKYVLGRARAVFPGFNKKDGTIPPALPSLVPPTRPEPKRSVSPAPHVIRH
ncbi:hypothetical protein [Arthrobacter sp. efr-133-TYG-104]|uniref:hypothetical protein n=1 Tax=Arthrobacter sp. efr-133-TYG-104 TaxID=3040324 RepID=UPI002551BCDD|nr:hypothetical protein [Arthrobacter sp. efr-133-TYG-104]